ncbi:MAG: sterol desaturase family protein, partial [Vicinamibacterales bacterium]
GVTKPLASFNPLWANIDYWAELLHVARRARRPLDRLRVLWKRPGWRPADLGGPLQAPEVDRASYLKFDVPLGAAAKLYVLVQFVVVLAAATLYFQQQDSLAGATRLLGAAVLGWSLVSLGGLLDRRPWAAPLEMARVLALVALLPWILGGLAP